MSSALVRKALAFVEGEESIQNKRRAKATRRQAAIVQDLSHPYHNKIKKINKSEVDLAEENIKKLLELSEPVTSREVTEKIVERAAKRKPLIEKTEVKKEESKSILFPEESFKNFEKKCFCH